MNEGDKIVQQMNLLSDAIQALHTQNDYSHTAALLADIEDLQNRLDALTQGVPIPQLSAADVQNLDAAANALQAAINNSATASDIVALATALANL